MTVEHGSFAAGDPKALARMVTNYRCGHCTGEVEELITDDTTGVLVASVRHDTGCPVLAGTVPAGPDMARAAFPDTFRGSRDERR
jgi:hypothetical protein